MDEDCLVNAAGTASASDMELSLLQTGLQMESRHALDGRAVLTVHEWLDSDKGQVHAAPGTAPRQHDSKRLHQVSEAIVGSVQYWMRKWWGQQGVSLLSTASKQPMVVYPDMVQKAERPAAAPAVAAPDSQPAEAVAQKTALHPYHRKMAPLAAVIFAMMTMLTIGGDDVIWLLPFFVGNEKWSKTFWYLVFMEIVVIVSWLIKFIMTCVATRHPDYPVRKVMQVISSIMLTSLCSYLFYEWWYEEDDGDDEDEEEAGKKEEAAPEDVNCNCGNAAAVLEGAGEIVSLKEQGEATKKDGQTKSPTPSVNDDSTATPPLSDHGDDVEVPVATKSPFTKSTEQEDGFMTNKEYGNVESQIDERVQVDAKASPDSKFKPHNEHHEHMSLRMLFVISMVGSSDNFAVYSYFLFDELINFWELFTGVLIASSMIAAVAHGALAFKPILRIVEKMPLWVIFAALSIWSYTEIAKN